MPLSHEEYCGHLPDSDPNLDGMALLVRGRVEFVRAFAGRNEYVPPTRVEDLAWLREVFIPKVRERLDGIFDLGFVSSSIFPTGELETKEIVTFYEEEDSLYIRVRLSREDHEEFFAAALQALGMRDAAWRLMEEGVVSFIGKTLLHREDLPVHARVRLGMFIEMPSRLKQAFHAILRLLHDTPELQREAMLPNGQGGEFRIYAELVGGREPSGVLDGQTVWFSFRVIVPTFSLCPTCGEYTPRRPDTLDIFTQLLICRKLHDPTVWLEDSILDAPATLEDGIHRLPYSESLHPLLVELREITRQNLALHDEERAELTEAYPVLSELKSGHDRVYLIVVAGFIRGYALWRHALRTRRQGPYLSMVLVDEAHRRQGFATRLIQETEGGTGQKWACGPPTPPLAALLHKLRLTDADRKPIPPFEIYWGLA